jgi:hypothetical protein
LIVTPIVGVAVPNLAGMVNHASHSAAGLLATYAWFIGIAYVTWEANLRLYLRFQDRTAWLTRPWHRVPPFALHAYKVVYDAEGDNDFLVSVKSAQWGEHLGTWPADHLHTMNKRWVIELREPTGDVAPLYLNALKQVTARLSDAGCVRASASEQCGHGERGR